MESGLSSIELKGDARRLLAAGEPEEAITILQGLLQADDSDAEAHGWLGAGLSMIGNHAESVLHLKQAALLEPYEASYPFNAGCAYDRLGDRDNAIAAYARALQLDGGYEQASQALQRLTGSLAVPASSCWPDDEVIAPVESAAGRSRRKQAANNSVPSRSGIQKHTGWGSMGQAAYGLPRTEEEPAIVRTARSLFIFTAIVYLGIAGFALMALIAPALERGRHAEGEKLLLIIGLVVLPLCVALAARCAWVVQQLRHGGLSMWRAVFNLAIVGCIVLVPPLGIVLNLPLLIAWVRPETKEWFGSA